MTCRGFNSSSLGFKGTPVQNDLQEFYAIIEFVNPGILGSSTAYRKVYEEPILRSRQPSCTEVPLQNICPAVICSTNVHLLVSPTGGASFRRGAGGRALSSDWHVYPEAHAGDNQPLPASPARLDAVLRALPSAAGAVQASPLPQSLQILPSGHHTNSHPLGLHHCPEKAVQPPRPAVFHRPGSETIHRAKFADSLGYTSWVVCCLFHRKEQIMDQKKDHSMKGWQSSSQDPTLQVNSLLRTLENSWFSQTCWAPSDDSAHQIGAYVSDSTLDTRDCWTKATT